MTQHLVTQLPNIIVVTVFAIAGLATFIGWRHDTRSSQQQDKRKRPERWDKR